MSEQKMLLDAFERIREADANIARLTSELAEARESNNKLRAELGRLHSLPDDLRTCAELSADDCNARVVGLRTTIAAQSAELSEARKRCEGETPDGFMLQNQDAGYLGNSPIWWTKGGNGYTAHIDNAHIFTEAEADQIIAEHGTHKKFVKWPASEVFESAHRTVDMQKLRPLAAARREQSATAKGDE